MGASAWIVFSPGRTLLEAVERARDAAYAKLPHEARSKVEALDATTLLQAMDIEPEDCDPWRLWIEQSPPATWYSLLHPGGGCGSILDVDHVLPFGLTDRRTRHFLPGGRMQLGPVVPGLVGVRTPSAGDMQRWFGTSYPTREEVGDGGVILDELERHEARGFALAKKKGRTPRSPFTWCIAGVTGD
jgi:hypothetical protein